MAFWSTDLGAQGADFGDPKRKFRFKVFLGGRDQAAFIWWAKSSGKPKFTITNVQHKFLNHQFHFPGNVEWQDVDMTLVDPAGGRDAVAHLSQIARNSGYVVPAQPNSKLESISKNSMVDALGEVIIQQIGSDGETIEEWVLKNPILTKCEFGDLAYGDAELIEVNIGFKYDWAECTIGGQEYYTPDGQKFN